MLVDLLERQDRGETIDGNERSSLHGEVVNHYLEVESQLKATKFAAAETMTGSHALREPHTGHQTGTVSDFSSKLLEPQAFGDYDLIEQIGKGGMGVVYKARQRKLNRIVALKMILAGKFADAADRDPLTTHDSDPSEPLGHRHAHRTSAPRPPRRNTSHGECTRERHPSTPPMDR